MKSGMYLFIVMFFIFTVFACNTPAIADVGNPADKSSDKILRTENYTPGVDGIMETTDDVLVSYSIYDYKNDLLDVIKIYGAGEDNQLNTDDDIIGAMTKNIYDNSNQLTGLYTISGAGPDQVWNTNDDLISMYTENTKIINNKTYMIIYNDPGTDLIFGTNDDVGLMFMVENDPDGNDNILVFKSYSFDENNDVNSSGNTFLNFFVIEYDDDNITSNKTVSSTDEIYNPTTDTIINETTFFYNNDRLTKTVLTNHQMSSTMYTLYLYQ